MDTIPVVTSQLYEWYNREYCKIQMFQISECLSVKIGFNLKRRRLIWDILGIYDYLRVLIVLVTKKNPSELDLSGIVFIIKFFIFSFFYFKEWFILNKGGCVGF